MRVKNFCTNLNDIYEYMKIMGGFSSNETARTKMNDFKDFLYNMPRNQHDRNPIFFYKYPNTPEIMYYTYSRMCMFISSNNIAYINHRLPKTDFNCNFINYAFNIPITFLPVFIAFILSYQDNLTHKASLHNFFSKMDEYIKRFPEDTLKEYNGNYDIKNFTKDISEQLNLILGKEYFLLLENIFFTYAKTTQERQILQNATQPLTERFTFECMFSKTNPSFYLDLLKHFEKKLSETSKFFEETYKLSNHQYLYKNKVACSPNDELKFLETIHQDFETSLQMIATKIDEFISSNHIENSEYNLCVNSYPEFDKFIDTQKDFLESSSKSITSKIYSYYGNISLLPSRHDGVCDQLKEISGRVYINNDTDYEIIIERQNIGYKLSKYTNIFEKATSRTLKSIDQLLHCVKKMSRKQAVTFNVEEIEKYDCFNIEKEFNHICSKLSDNKMKNMISEYPSYYIIFSSYIESIAFSYNKLDEILQNIEKANVSENRENRE